MTAVCLNIFSRAFWWSDLVAFEGEGGATPRFGGGLPQKTFCS